MTDFEGQSCAIKHESNHSRLTKDTAWLSRAIAEEWGEADLPATVSFLLVRTSYDT